MQDEQDRAEALDDDKGGDPAPDRPPGAQAYGAAGAEPHATESVVARAAREEPDPTTDPDFELPPPDPDRIVEADDPSRMVDDPALADIATERAAPRPAEELAVQDPDEYRPIPEADLEDDDEFP